MKILRPQDIYVLLALVAHPDDDKWTYDLLADRLDLSTSQIYRSLQRARSRPIRYVRSGQKRLPSAFAG